MTALDALTDALQSQSTSIVAFSIAADVSKLSSVLPLARATRVVDLATSTDGLAAAVRRWLPTHRLDKAQQRSDWALRPLTPAQVAYAAADAAVLLPLWDAMRAAGAAPSERDVAPAPRTSTDSDAAEPDDDGALAVARAVVARTPGCSIVAADAVPADAVEVNALAVEAGDRKLLVVAEAGKRLDLKWLALALDTPRRRVRLSSRCVEAFGVAPHRVPPIALRDDVSVVATPALLASTRPLWGSAGGDGYRVVFEGGAGIGKPLPDPALYYATLDDDRVCLAFGRLPCICASQGTRERKLEPGRPRRIEDAGEPRKPLVGDDGTVVRDLNTQMDVHGKFADGTPKHLFRIEHNK